MNKHVPSAEECVDLEQQIIAQGEPVPNWLHYCADSMFGKGTIGYAAMMTGFEIGAAAERAGWDTTTRSKENVT